FFRSLALAWCYLRNNSLVVSPGALPNSVNPPKETSPMNESTALQPYEEKTSAFALLLEGQHLDRMQAVAKMMAGGKATVPQHLRGNEADCLAITMQAIRWGMDPFVVASKTHVTQGGVLGYEAQLVNAVCLSLGAFQDEPEYEFIGDWSKILGKVKEMKPEKGG